MLTIEHSRFAYYADFAIYLMAVLMLPGLLWHHSPTALHWAIPLAGLAGLVLWSLIEYAMHRIVFHGVQPFESLHAEHHRRPLALIATPTLVSVTVIALLVWLPANQLRRHHVVLGPCFWQPLTTGQSPGYPTVACANACAANPGHPMRAGQRRVPLLP